jgi:uncharacterized membrane protein YraQ (UPF0718 family)
MKKLPAEILIGILLFAVSIILLLLSPEKVLEAFTDNWSLILKTLGLTIVAVGISVLIHYIVPEDFAERYLARTEFRHRVWYLFFATILGILTPGPVYAIYPIVLALKKKGVENPILVSYITGQTIIGPARIPFEMGLFGLDFFLYRLALSIVMGTLAGILYILFSKILPDKE